MIAASILIIDGFILILLFGWSVLLEIREAIYFFANVPSDLSLLAFGIPPAREAESAGGMPKVPKGQGLGRLARWAYLFLIDLRIASIAFVSAVI